MSRAPLLLLPPSEGHAPGGDGPPWAAGPHRFDTLDGSRREVLGALVAAMGRAEPERAALLGVRGARLAAATAANLGADAAPTLPALVRYTGVLYDALGYPALPARLRRRIDAQVVVLSGLWGVLAPTDPIPEHKLKMGATLPGIGGLARWWRPRLSPVVDDLAARRTVWDLLPGEHAAALAPLRSARSVIRVRFVDDVARDGERRLVTVAHWNKLLKGALVRHIVEHQVDEVAGLAEFTHPEGYALRPDLSEVHPGHGPSTAVLVARR